MQKYYQFSHLVRPQILIVEPALDVRLRMSKAFHDIKLRVVAVSNGAEALDIIQGFGLPDIALIELLLPDMNGMEFATQLYNRKALPIIMTAYHAEVETVVNLLDLVAEDFIKKPFAEREMVARVMRLLPKEFLVRNASHTSLNGETAQFDDANARMKLN